MNPVEVMSFDIVKWEVVSGEVESSEWTETQVVDGCKSGVCGL